MARANTSTNTRSRSRKSSKGGNGAPEATPSEVEAATDDQTDDDEVEAAGSDGTSEEPVDRNAREKALRKLPKHLQYHVRMNTVAERVIKYAKLMAPWGIDELTGEGDDETPPGVATQAVAAMKAFVDYLANMPEDYEPPAPKRAKRSGPKNIVVGGKVDIRPKFRDRYDGILEDEDFTGLEVTMVASGYVKVVTNSDGESIVLPRGQVMGHRPPSEDDDGDDS